MHFHDVAGWRPVCALVTACALGACAAGAPLPDDARRREVVALIEGHDADLPPAQREARHERLAASPHALFRGAPYLFWRDLGADPRLARFGGDELRGWILGDVHVENFGCFEDARHEVVYDLNDFDEVVVADPQLDLWRLATSLLLVLREQGDLDEAEQREVVTVLARGYLSALELFRDGDAEREHRLTARDAFGLLDDLLIDAESKQSRDEQLDEWTTSSDGRAVLDVGGRDELEPAPDAVVRDLERAWPGYVASLDPGREFEPGYFEVKSIARRVDQGTASLGLDRYYVLVEGPSIAPDDDRLLDVRAQTAPAGPAPDGLAPEVRCVTGERALAPTRDPHLGHLRLGEQGFTVHERSPYRRRLDLAKLTTVKRAREVAEQWGWILAAAHARGDRDGDPARCPASYEDALLARVGDDAAGFAALVYAVAQEQADRVTRDHAAFVAARRSRP